MRILIDSNREQETVEFAPLAELAEFALRAENAPENCEVSITLVDEEEMAQLNMQYREKYGPTDVLSFELDDPWDEESDAEVRAIGDIVIAPTVAKVQAVDYDSDMESEMNLLVVHGVLHLLGYDHLVDEEAEEMELRERAILSAWSELER